MTNANQVRAWVHFINKDNGPFRNSAIQALKSAGLITHSFDPLVSEDGPGVLFFDEVTQELFDFLREVSRNGCERVIAVAVSSTALASGGAWQLLHAGASDAIAWDHSGNPAAKIAARFERWSAVDRLAESPLIRNNLVGQSPIWKSLLRQIVEVASFTDASVLIMGESGTGKELVARLIHTLDQRTNKNSLVILDCTTIVPELSGSEFFGHERGAFTGAVAPRDGAFALANGGTLFLDEVGELPLGLQAQLLRVIQERTYKRVGGNNWQQTDFRLVCATNKDLLQEVRRGKFRHDLYYRIASFVCKLPPLRERTEDIMLLARFFIQELRSNQQSLEIDDAVREYLLKREYPGNIRDLKQLMTRISHHHVGSGPITVGDVPEEERPLTELSAADWQDVSFERSIRRAIALGVGLKEIGRAARRQRDKTKEDKDKINSV